MTDPQRHRNLTSNRSDPWLGKLGRLLLVQLSPPPTLTGINHKSGFGFLLEYLVLFSRTRRLRHSRWLRYAVYGEKLKSENKIEIFGQCLRRSASLANTSLSRARERKGRHGMSRETWRRAVLKRLKQCNIPTQRKMRAAADQDCKM